ncbi:helix-turn-helix domain-containing protein [Wolbachia endosymbiont of Folsomia candida]|uniref:helix-turn-helix domain-containing protein n=1 Tax=Wolbachia endosymbiont of Folsomia candida TaxID=169402 RepID=UPI000A8ED92D|nr:XRE family transcriptional regulator [Wolbachia endosymbiont of Folsomia candida]APR98708.1 XRE family transcriptional regulator [Wolbachia endosymbiont of Folsomia candida]
MFVTKWSDKNKARAELLSVIKGIIKANNWTQAKAANVLKLDQPKISLIKNLKVKEFSLERIFLLLSRLNCEVEIMVKRKGNLDKSNYS